MMSGTRALALGFLSASLAACTAEAAIIQLGQYGLGEPGTVGTTAPARTPLSNSIQVANAFASFQAGSGVSSAIVTTDLAAPGSTAALRLNQGSSRNSGWHGMSPGYVLADNWAVQLWFKTPDSTTSSDSYMFLGGSTTTQVSLELSNGHVNVLRGADTSTRVTGFGYTPNEWFRATLISYQGSLQLYEGTDPTAAATFTMSPKPDLSTISLGFGRGASPSRGASGTFDEMKVWSFDPAVDTLDEVKVVVGVPEPGAFPLLAAGLAALFLGYHRSR